MDITKKTNKVHNNQKTLGLCNKNKKNGFKNGIKRVMRKIKSENGLTYDKIIEESYVANVNSNKMQKIKNIG